MKTFFVVLIALAAISTAADPCPIVSVAGGKVRGSMLDQGRAAFKSIACVQHPIGDLGAGNPSAGQDGSAVKQYYSFDSADRSALAKTPRSGYAGRETLTVFIWEPLP